MMPIHLPVELRLDLRQALPIHAPGPAVATDPQPGRLQVLALVDLVHQRVDLLLPGRVEPVRQSPRAIAYGFFAPGTDPHDRPYSSGFPWFAPTTIAGRLPPPTRLPIARSRSFRPAYGTIRPSDDSPGIASHFAVRLIGSLIPAPPGNRTSPPGVTS